MNDPLRSLGVLGVVGGLASTGSVGVVLPELPLEVSLPRSDFLLPFSPFADKDGCKVSNARMSPNEHVRDLV